MIEQSDSLRCYDREPQQRYIEDVFGRACYEGFFHIRDLERMTMKDDEMREFIKGAERREMIDDLTGWKSVVFIKAGVMLVYDAIAPSSSS